MNELRDVVPEWQIFCLHLGVSNTELKAIQKITLPKMYTNSMLAAWIDQKGDKATIQKILAVLRSPVIANPALASRLETKDERIQELLRRPLPSAGWYLMYGFVLITAAIMILFGSLYSLS